MNRKLRIGLMGLAAKPIPMVGGNICAPHEIVYDIAKGLTKKGHEVTIFSGEDSSNEIKTICASLNSAWTEFGPENENLVEYTARRIEYDLILSTEAIKMFKSGELDIINCHDFRTSPYLFAQAGAKALYSVHGALKNHQTSYDRYRYKMMASAELGVLSMSHENEEVAKDLGLTSYGYTPNGIDVNKFQFSENNRDGILVVARMIPIKRIKESIDAALSAGESITLIGPEAPGKENSEYFKSLKDEYFVKDNVTYLGYKSQEEILPYYQRAKALLYLSKHEGMPMTVLEAMSSGLPVIASPVGGVKDIIEDGVDGILIDHDSEEGLSESIKKVSEISNKKCREKIEKKFSIEAMVDSYEAAYYNFLKVAR